MITKLWLIGTIIWLFTQFKQIDAYRCSDEHIYQYCNGRWNGNYDTQRCVQDQNGNYQSCFTSFCRGCSSDLRYYYRWSHDWWGGSYNALWIGRRCPTRCQTCNGGDTDNNCFSCRNSNYKWKYVNRCRYYCPNQMSLGQSSSYSAVRGQYQAGSNQCQLCDSTCAWCYGGSTTCYTCISSHYLIDDQNLCTTNYGSGRQHTCHDNLQCVDDCPQYYYFPVLQGSTGSYSWTGLASRYYSQVSSYKTYRRSTNVCHPCDKHCDTCDGHTQYTCKTCSQGNYMWRQRNKLCQDTCPYGVYGSGWIGEYINSSTSVYVSGGKTYRYCQLCNDTCIICSGTFDNCYVCKDDDALIDLQPQCQIQYLDDTTCIQCQPHSCERNNYCMQGGCPTYFYFQIRRRLTMSDIDYDPDEDQQTDYQHASSSDITNMLYSDHPRYSNYTQSATFTTKYSNSRHYRKYTDLCMLCDQKCIKCSGPLNTHCSQCRNKEYKWVGESVCDSICRPGQYIALDQPYPANQTQCRTCMHRCQICNMQDHNCTVCVGKKSNNQYNYTLTSAGFLYINDSSYSTCLLKCPGSEQSTVDIGHYGSIETMVCLPCPYPCLDCNIDQLKTDQQLYDVTCSDNYCSNGIVCTDCLPGFSLVAGKCIQQDNCLQYAYYEQSATSTSFSTDNCKCLDGYSSSGSGRCDIRCYIRCRTCTGPGSSQCLTCENGYILSGSSCVDSNKRSQRWIKSVIGEGTNNFYPHNTNYDCGGFQTKWGYRYASSNKYYRHIMSSLPSTGYYAVQVKMTLLFIDQFDIQGAMYMTVGSSTQAVWKWNFDTKQAYGQQLCGDNRMDYVLNLYAEIPKTWSTSSQYFYLKSNQDLIQTYSDFKSQWNIGVDRDLILHWGINQAMFTALSCHSSCSQCTGPTENDCTVCSTTGQIPVDGKCQCNSGSNGNGYYQWADGVCRGGCANGYFSDSIARKCVQPLSSNCTQPYRFGYTPSGWNYGYCVIDCPSSTYASMKTMTCISDCSTQSQYKYTYGASRTCQDTCPNGYVADPDYDNGRCLEKCRTGWFLLLQDRQTNPLCSDNCTTGYAYGQGLQICVEDCPNGFFKQVLSDKPKCVSICQNGQFGDSDTGACTASCAAPKFGDPNNNLCVDTCSDGNQYMQVRMSDLYRSCVDTCQTGQYGNPFTHFCSNYTTDCPDGYFADTHVHLCVKNCSQVGQVAQNTTKKCQTTCSNGYAHWQGRVCVEVCPSQDGNTNGDGMFGTSHDPLNKSCVTSCDFANTGLYADIQAGRTCVSVCSDAPVATFGQNDTSNCVQKCTLSGQYGDPFHPDRPCVTHCTLGTFSYIQTKICVEQCPDSYYSDRTTIAGKGQCVTACTDPYYADPVQNTCRLYCRWGYYGLQTGIRPCVQTCPYNWFGINMTYTSRKCVQQCDDGYWGDLETSMCYDVQNMCSNDTYADRAKRLCVIATNCTEGTFADPFTKGCESSCSNGYYADDNINTCVQMCSDNPDQFGLWGICRSSCASANRFADWQLNRTCQRRCSASPLVTYGRMSDYYCVQAQDCPTGYFGDNTTQTCVDICADPFPYGDPLTNQCVLDCPDGYYGQDASNQCVTVCDFSTNPPHYADNLTGNCQQLCSLTTFGVNASADDHVPSCQYDCPPASFARDTDRICVNNCGTGLYGDPLDRVCHSDPHNCPDGYYADDFYHMCVIPSGCQSDTDGHFFAQNSTKTCVKKCDSPNYGDNALWMCIQVCNTTHYGENTTRLCLSGCSGYSSFAEDQNRLCVARCSDQPFQHYADLQNSKCVEPLDCPTSPHISYAENSSQTCVQYCDQSNDQWADVTTKRCVTDCPNGYYKDDSTTHNLCSSTCPGTYRYRDNYTESCVDVCPIDDLTFGDQIGDRCVKTCPSNYYAQVDDNRRCVLTCKAGTWGNKITRVCITDPKTQCPPNTWADNFTHLCTQECSSSQNYYGQNQTKICVTSCPDPSFAYDGTRVCIDICPSSLVNSGLFGDPLTAPTRKCYHLCQTSGYYRDPQNSRTCVQNCKYNSTYKSYKDPTTMSCQKVCSSYPEVRYADDNLKSCQLSCAGSLKKNEADQTCVEVCPNLYDPTTDRCVQSCPRFSTNGVLYADLIDKICVVASSCPTDTWADSDNNICTDTCPINTYKYGDHCVYHCPDDYFMDNSTQSCVTPLNCPNSQYADNQTRSCVSRCIGTFGDSILKRCINRCFGSKYGDPFTHTCETSCSNGLNINTQNNSCVASCQVGLFQNPDNYSCSETCNNPYYADDNTKACVQDCTANPMTFSNIISSKRVCVSACQPGQMHDLINRKCVSICPSNTYSYDVNMSCVAFCPAPSHYQLGNQCVTNCSSSNKYADDISRTCVSTCPTGTFKDPLSFKCVVQCPHNPVQYYISQILDKCTTSCPQTTYASNQDMKCVYQCPLSPRMFAEEVNNVCVQTCPASSNTFADLDSGKCVSQCPNNQFADSRDRTCKKNCSYLFADTETDPPFCVSQCSSGLFANQLTFTCDGICPDNYYAHTPSRKCLKFCPYNFFADTNDGKCVPKILCPQDIPYADPLTHYCTDQCSNNQWGFLQSGTSSGGQCVLLCPDGYFSNPLSGLCEQQCPEGYFSQQTNNTCAKSCPDDKYMDSVNKQCVTQCPQNDNLFADLFNRTCVTSCEPTTFTFSDDLSRKCETVCTGNQYADSNDNTCVNVASCSLNKLTDPYYKKCVDKCYNGTFGYQGHCHTECPTQTDDVYADFQSSLCVPANECPQGTFGNPFTKSCVQFCSIETSTFSHIDSKKCVTNCELPLYADNTTRSCVEVCPQIPVMFGDNDSRTCVHECNYLQFADVTINLCVSNCPDGYFADQSTFSCVTKCPQGKYGNNISNYCVDTCPSPNYYGDPKTRECILYCPQGTYADIDHNRQCQPTCSSNVNTFSQNQTNKCVSNCLTGFKNKRTKQCIQVCTSGFYGYEKICYQDCPSVSPTVFADDSSNLCVQDCPEGTYGDLSTRKCVHICPLSDDTFADDSTGLCEQKCQQAGFYADQSTRKCVEQCPSVPALYGKLPQKICVSECDFNQYASNQTRKCQVKCPDGTYADNTTMKCELVCPTEPLMFGQNTTNKCVQKCDASRNMYADNSTRTCVYHCSNISFTFADQISRTCVDTCPDQYFARNDTQTCEKFCPPNTFADKLLRICVQKCSADPIFYGNKDTWICVQQCPQYSFGNPLNQECQKNIHGVSTCPAGHFADRTTQLCVEVCPMIEDLYGDPQTKHCQSSCSDGYVADNSTMTCVEQCPSYPDYYQNQINHRCVKHCPPDTFADPISRKCVETCPDHSYAQNATQRCVQLCPNQPLSYADDTEWICVQKCPDGYFGDNSTLKCVQECPQNQATFGYTTDNICIKVCPPNYFADQDTRQCETGCAGIFFADNSTNKCVQQCPKYPPFYADPTTNQCVSECPDTYFAYQNNRTCLQQCPSGFYRQNSTRTCVQACDFSELTYADNNTNYCVSRCSEDSWADPTKHICVQTCPDQPLMYADNSSQSCVSKCPGSTYGDNQTRSCVDVCPTGSLSFPDDNLCVLYCPKNYFAYQDTAFCLGICPNPFYGDPSTRTCVQSCPLSQLLYADNSSRQCVSHCPQGSYADKETISCVQQCPDNPSTGQQTYAADYNNVCVQQCALPYYGYPPEKKCLNNCPNPYYNDVRDHMCYLCPSVCQQCSTYEYCTKCIPNYYLQDGQCVDTCSQLYFSNNNTMKCVSSPACAPYFGVNETHECKDSCPDGSFKNYKVYRCDQCQQSCLICTSWNTCQVCIQQSKFANNFCYPYCNLTHTYYDHTNNSCLDQCNNGTYLDVLFCKTCSAQCETCYGKSNNCTLCAKGLYLQNQKCASSCSSNSRPNSTRHCVYCGQSCDKPLDFDTNITNIDGESTMFVTFTDDVNFDDDLQNIFAINQKRRRRLEQNSDFIKRRMLANYRYERVDERTVKIVFLDGTDASDVQLEILKPQSITDKNGNIPIKTRDDVQVDLNEIYQVVKQQQSGSTFASFFQVMAIISILTFLFDIQFMKYLQLIFIHYFVVMTLPPSLSSSFASLRYSTLSYLPTMYPIPQAVLKETVPGKIYDVCGDFSFLRTAGFVLTPLAVLLILTIIVKILTVPQINRFKSVRVWCKQQFDQKFKLSFFIQFVSIFYTGTIFFIFLQMRDYQRYDTFYVVGIIISDILLLVLLVVICYLSYSVISFFIIHKKLSYNLKKATDIILQQKDYHKLNTGNIFLFEMKKIDLRNIFYPKINNENIFPFRVNYRFNFLSLMCLPITYLRATIISLIIALSYQSTLTQMSLCIPVNVLTLLYFIKARPYSFKFKKRRIKNYLVIFNQATLIFLEFLLLALGILHRDLATSEEKQTLGNGINIYLTIVITINFIYFLFRLGVQIWRKMFIPFSQTQLFKTNFPNAYQKLYAKKDKKKLLRGVDPRAKEAIRAMVKSYKYKKSALRPDQNDKANPQLPIKYKLKYFDRDSSSVGTRSSMTKSQKKNMLKQIFKSDNTSIPQDKEILKDFEEVVSNQGDQQTQFEEYEQEIQIKAKDLEKYVKNAEELLKLKRNEDDDEDL